MSVYKKPKNRAHKGFFYLDDEVVINSLSALESGKVDEIVSKTVIAREGGLSGEIKGGVPGIGGSLGGGKKSSSEVEEEIVRTRTRFSIFDGWYSLLTKNEAIGTFDGWGADALDGVQAGDTIELRADLSLGPLQTVMRLFLWFADQATKPGTIFSQKGEELKATKQGAQMMRTTMGVDGGEEDEIPLVAVPVGDAGPQVILAITPRWMIGKLGQLGGDFGIVAQVARLVPEGEQYPILRLTKDVTPTPMEINTLKTVVTGYVDPAKELGVTVDPEESVVRGPALILNPIAIYR